MVEELFRGARTLVLRARRAHDGRAVVIKTLAATHPAPEEAARLRREFRLGRDLALAGLIRHLELVELADQPALVLEDIGGSSIDRPDVSDRPLRDRVALALRLAEALAELHRAGVVHRDVNPSNVVWNRATGELRLIDLGIATRLERHRPARSPLERMEGTLRYLAPEQTGRTNRAIDRRSDLYSLGATLYELLTGAPPFADDEPLALVHAHLARDPRPPVELDPTLPEVVSQLVLRLLRKAPEERFQTAEGVAADLRRCLGGLDAGTIAPFPLASDDVDAELRFPQRLLGRERAAAELLAALDRATSGERVLALVAGSPGIGKTALVHDLQGPLALRSGSFLEGKFDQLREGRPFAPIARALGRFVRGLLGGDEETLAGWRARYQEAAGELGGLLVELAPELALLIGPQPSAPELPAADAENRFHLLFRELIRAHATPEHPCVLFLDDLQWADLPSLRLLERLATDVRGGHLLLIGAYRDGEVDAAHPLALMVDRLSADPRRAPVRVALGPLELSDYVALLAECLAGSEAATAPLAALLHERTKGNPLYVQRLLDACAARALIRRDLSPGGGRWAWDLAAIASLEPEPDLVAFLIGRLGELPIRARRVLEAAACIGTELDLRLLATLEGSDLATVQADLAPAIALDLVQPRGVGWVLEPGEAADAVPEEALVYTFVHDHIRKAALASMKAEDAERLHLRLGRVLLDGAPAEPGPRLFDVVDHLGLARRLLTPLERERLAGMALQAARQARRATAFASALAYAELGIDCLERGWDERYEESLALHLEGAEAAYLVNRAPRMREWVATVRARARTPVDRARAARIEMDAQISAERLLDGIATSRRALAELGWVIPEQPTGDDVGRAVGRAMSAIGVRAPAELVQLPLLEDPTVRAAMELLCNTCAPAYYAVPPLLPILACELVALSVERGLAPSSPFGFAVYGIVLVAMGRFREAHSYGLLALELIDRLEERHLEARVRFVVNNLVCVWVEPLDDRIEALREVYLLGRQTGDLEYAALACHGYLHNSWYGGRPLGALAVEAERYDEVMRSVEQHAIITVNTPILVAIRNMAGLTPDPARLDSASQTEEQLLGQLAAGANRSALAVAWIQVTILRHHFADPRSAWEAARTARAYLDGVPATYHLPAYHVHAALAALSLLGRADLPSEERAELERAVDADLAALTLWADAAPAHHRHRVLLVEAERAAVRGDATRAEGLFRAAANAAQGTRFVNERALILERAARRLLAGDGIDRSLGRALLEDAWQAYRSWGAEAKTTRLAAEFPRFLRRAKPASQAASDSGQIDVDSAAVIRASRAISAEIDPDRLLLTLFRLALEAGGARAGMLVLERAGEWRVVVRGGAGSAPELLDAPLALASGARHPTHTHTHTHTRGSAPGAGGSPGEGLGPADVPLALLRYGLRTGETLVLDDLREPGGLVAADDPYFASRGARAVLVVPLHRKGQLAALLYLEHDVPGAFTPERVELLRLLLSQAAVSLENAELYAAQLRVTSAQSRFVPYQFLRSLGRADIASVEPGDHVERKMSVLFSDLRDFTPIAESLGARSVIALLNEHFSLMEPPIAARGGFIDSFNGDEIMALFDADAEQAVRAAIAMQHALARYNREVATGPRTERPPLRMGVGVNTGALLLGAVGGRERLKCGVVGDAVNLASRIQGLTKTYGASVLISESTHASLADPSVFQLRVVDRVAVFGRQQAAAVYEVLDAEVEPLRSAKLAALGALRDGQGYYHGREFARAMACFAQSMASAPTDPVPAIYFDRCRRWLIDPPPPDWQGYERLAHK